MIAVMLAACGGQGAPERRATGDTRDGGNTARTDGVRWTRTFSGGNDLATDVAVTADGVIVVGNYRGALTTDDAHAAAIGDSDMFVSRLGADGSVRWLRGLGSAKADFAWAVAVDGDVAVVAAESDGTVELDGVSTRTSGQEERDDNPALALALDPKGTRAWWRGFASEERGALRDVAVARGRIAVGGRSTSREKTRNLGVGDVECDSGTAFIAQLDSSGAVTWARCSRSRFRTGLHVVEYVAIGRDGAVAACGSLAAGQMSFGGETVQHDADHGPVNGELFVVSFAPDGAARWLLSPKGQTRNSTCSGIAILDDGTVVLATNADGTFGGVELPEGAIVALDASGKPRWTASLPVLLSASSAPVAALTVTGSRIWVAGSMRDEGVVIALDPASGDAVGPTLRLGDVDPRAVAATEDVVYIAGRQPVRGDTHDAVVIALPSRPR